MRSDEESRPGTGSAAAGVDPSDLGLYRGWYVVAGGFVCAFVVFGLSYAFGVFLEPIQRDLGLSRSGVSFVFSLQTVVIYLAAAVLGVLADRFGVRRLLGAGAVVLAIGGLWTSRAATYPGLLAAYGVCTAVGLGAIYVVSYATVPRWFQRRRGLATGIATAGLGIGMVALAPAASALVAALGWRLAILALVLAAAAAVAAVVPLFADDPASSDAAVAAEREFPEGVPDRTPPPTGRRTDANSRRSRALGPFCWCSRAGCSSTRRCTSCSSTSSPTRTMRDSATARARSPSRSSARPPPSPGSESAASPIGWVESGRSSRARSS